MESLFDRLLNALQDDLAESLPSSEGRDVAIQRLIPGLRKKYIGKTSAQIASQEDRERVAKAAFLGQNDFCKAFNAFNTGTWSKLSDFTRFIVTDARLLIDDFFHPAGECILSDAEILLKLRTGPGKSSGISNPDTSFYFKSCVSDATASSTDIFAYMDFLIKRDPLTFYAEKYRKDKLKGKSIVKKPKLTTVPKDLTKERVICTQPDRDMQLQLAVHDIISGHAKKRRWFDLEVQQECNRHLANLGSTVGGVVDDHGLFTWNFCTADLKSASDFPRTTAQLMLPEVVFDFCNFISDDEFEIDGRVEKLHMFSTMGTGFTFVIMTLILSAIVKTLYNYSNLPQTISLNGEVVKTWAVFGDDIIVDKRVWHALLKVLSELGFVVNVEKSFCDGPFRESCGADWYNNYPVRPVYVENLATKQEAASLCNRLLKWGFTHNVYLTRSVALLTREFKHNYVPPYSNDDAGIKVPFDVAVKEGGVRTINGMYLYSSDVADIRQKRLIRYKYGRAAWTWIHDRSSPRIVLDETMRENANPFGVLLAMIGGYVRDGSYSIRTNKIIYSTQAMVSPLWNFGVTTEDVLSGLEQSSSGHRIKAYRSDGGKDNVAWNAYIADTFLIVEIERLKWSDSRRLFRALEKLTRV